MPPQLSELWLVQLVNGPRDGERFAVADCPYTRWRTPDGHAYELAMNGHGTPETFGRDEAGRWHVKAFYAGKVPVP